LSTDAYARAAVDRECADIAATESGRNERLNRGAFALGQLVGAGLLQRREAEEGLLAAAEMNGYVAKDGNAAARSTIKSGLDRGQQKPRSGIGSRPDPNYRPAKTGSREHPALGWSPPDQPHTTGTETDPVVCDRARVAKARALWARRKPLNDRYLRARGLRGPFPPTLGFLPARGNFLSAMIAAYGLATELEPGRLEIAPNAITAVHLTRLRPDLGGKAEGAAKITVGRPLGSPIVLAPPNDLLGLAIAEGIEDALSVHQATGLGAWAAGAAGYMPALADAVPNYIDFVTILGHSDLTGTKNARELGARLTARGILCKVTFLGAEARAA
jgi:hypothetical protein